jgi:saccharopine dehydrogenase-like NADP-dependent oxidoreductase
VTALGLETGDPMVVLAQTAAVSQDGGRRAEQLLEDAKTRCVATAAPTPGAERLLRAAAADGRHVIVISNNSELPIRLDLAEQVSPTWCSTSSGATRRTPHL